MRAEISLRKDSARMFIYLSLQKENQRFDDLVKWIIKCNLEVLSAAWLICGAFHSASVAFLKS